MKKPKTYNLDREIYEAISKLAQAARRSDSDWLNIHLGNSLPTKEVSKPKTAVIKPEVIYPENLNIDAWDLWIAHRKKVKLKAYKTDLKMKELATMGNHDEQLQIVMISMKNEYAGLFPLKINNSSSTKTSGNFSACEDFING